MHKWLSVVGIGEDGWTGLSAVARSLVDRAEILVGGDRHLAMVPTDDRPRWVWTSPIQGSIEEILLHRGQQICVLASGDPQCYGIGVTLLRHIPITEMTIIPVPSTFSLVCARLGWPLSAVETLSLCSRPPTILQAYLYPGAKLLILSEGKHTPATVAKILTQRGFGRSLMTVLERLGGVQERLVSGVASTWTKTDLAELNAIAVECIADPGTIALPRTAGLPDDAYHHDGQLTKREVRALTLSALAPLPGQLLWDVGAGCGSIAIEWMRSHPRCNAIAIEKTRSHYIVENASALGTPHLQIIEGAAPTTLKELPVPDAIFIGGGLTAADMFETCWDSLKPGGRLVANAVTLEGEQKLFEWYQQVGGNLIRIGIQRAEAIGSYLGWKPMVPVTQWSVMKS
ncbi:MAG: precorrin-6y C5,15-methyltransferase (decarboxylating) subunit CbiE [Acaryochloridaceae cyanobacterium RU_4_10]|nr:precorrin-6y C5,15-methyltransferase (decarboxylating) subunit CbiE [Acaryochloridaceae cyanobacterium RU_4_10]